MIAAVAEGLAVADRVVFRKSCWLLKRAASDFTVVVLSNGNERDSKAVGLLESGSVFTPFVGLNAFSCDPEPVDLLAVVSNPVLDKLPRTAETGLLPTVLDLLKEWPRDTAGLPETGRDWLGFVVEKLDGSSPYEKGLVAVVDEGGLLDCWFLKLPKVDRFLEDPI